ncbi:MAG: DUF447 domain-containing protein [Candidatus Hodarchaeota archaeon]
MNNQKSGRLQIDLNANHVYESIISVYDEKMEPYFSPMGVIFKNIKDDGKLELLIKVYPTSTVFSFLQSRKECVVQFPSSKQLNFFFFAFKDELKSYLSKLKQGFVTKKSMVVNAPIIDSINNFIEAKIINVTFKDLKDQIANINENSSKVGIMTLESRVVHIGNSIFQPITRYSGMFMECLIILSRMKYLPVESDLFAEKQTQVNYFLGKMKKLFPNEEKNEILSLLLNKLESGIK